ncbi:MAG TPA: GIY-YIG nuclease family protein [Oscillospiraceae bacterium]|nr:GIY-YIG nuclease family protein [Oscillospiraceae bacterium]
MAKTQTFIEKARAVHGDNYSYAETSYTKAHEKVIINCSDHGSFEQSANDHLKGYGCAKCGKESRAAKIRQKAKDVFIEKARAKHGDRYGYDRAVYVYSHERVIITCKKHGDFEQTPNHHLKGRGCAKCGFEEVAAKNTQEAKDRFIEKACAMHGDKYDYLKTVYVRALDKVIITCKIHGDFEQTPNCHLRGNGCPSCPARYDQPTNLYLMHNGLGKVKIGYSIDTNRRITELNSNAPFEAELLETWTLTDTPTVRKIESKVHRKLEKYHAGLSGFNGATEWFNASPDTARKHILDAIRGSHVVKNYVKNNPQMSLI